MVPVFISMLGWPILLCVFMRQIGFDEVPGIYACVGTWGGLIAGFFVWPTLHHLPSKVKVDRESKLKRVDRVLEKFQDRKAANRWLQPRVLNLVTTDALWKPAVEICLQRCGPVVIDVSDVTDNIIWELHHALGHNPPRCVMIASAEFAQSWQSRDPSDGKWLQLVDLLGAKPTLTYRTQYPKFAGRERRQDTQMFVTHLSAAIDNVACALVASRESDL